MIGGSHRHRVDGTGFGSKRFLYLWGSHPKRFRILDPRGFRIFWIQKVFVSFGSKGFRSTPLGGT
jgi:hypothetical protein